VFFRSMNRRRDKGFTVAELITVTAIVGILASIALPVARFGLRRRKETELQQHLRKITWAIDQYNDLRTKGVIKEPPALGQGPWPKTLEELTKPIELLDGKKLRFLTDRDLIDPMTGRSEWRLVSSSDDPDSNSSDDINIWDIHSKSTAPALDGKTHYNEW
jgi:general secretion pathway protein G